MSSCFISDLHLDNKRKNVKKSFFNFLESEASEFDNLYILGDLFEVWIGDDFSDGLTNEVISNLKKYSNKNKKIFIMHGNRDFLLGKEFVQDCGAELISDPLILNYENRLEELENYFNEFNIKFEPAEPLMKSDLGKSYRDAYSDMEIKLVEKIYSEDIVRFEQKF